MSFANGLTITNKGKALQAKAQTGVVLNFSRLAAGDGNYSGDIGALNALVSQKLTIPINKLATQSGGKATVGGVLTNSGLATGFYFRELGLFANDPDEGEILYCYTNAGSGAEFIPAQSGAESISKQIDILSIVGQAENVTATIDESLLFVTLDQFEGHVNDGALHIPFVVAEGAANTYAATLPYDFDTYFNGQAAAVEIPANNTGGSTIDFNGKGAAPLVTSKGTALPPNKLVAGAVVSVRYSSVFSAFQLQGEGGEYGTAAAGDVRMGKSVGTDNGLVNGAIPVQNPGAVNASKQNVTLPAGIYDNPIQITGGVNTDDATATAADMLAGKTAYKAAQKITGTIPVIAGDTLGTNVNGTLTPGRLYIQPPSNRYWPGNGFYTYFDDPNFLAGYIKKNIKMFGLTGTYSPSYADLGFSTPLQQRLQNPAAASSTISCSDGTYVYVLLAVTNYPLYKFDKNGRLVASINTGITNAKSMRSAGNYLWIVGSGGLYRAPKDLSSTTNMNTGGYSSSDQGVSIAGGYVWFQGSSNVYKFDINTGEQVGYMSGAGRYTMDVDASGNIYYTSTNSVPTVLYKQPFGGASASLGSFNGVGVTVNAAGSRILARWNSNPAYMYDGAMTQLYSFSNNQMGGYGSQRSNDGTRHYGGTPSSSGAAVDAYECDFTAPTGFSPLIRFGVPAIDNFGSFETAADAIRFFSNTLYFLSM